MSRNKRCWPIAAGLALALAAIPALAAENENRPQSEATNAVGNSWTTRVAPDEQPAAEAPAQEGQQLTLTPEQTELVHRISDYFNSIKHLQGDFVQINPDNQKTSGQFYVRRPGLLRFDYAPPSKLRIVSDGSYLSIEDHDLKTVDQYPLDATPFRLLLSENVDLMSEARIIDLSQSDSVASLTVEDKSDGSRGRLQLFFSLPDIELREWIITDPQGLDTRIQLTNVIAGQEVNKDFFKSTALDLQTLQDR